MFLMEVCRWVVSRLLRQPVFWFWLLACFATWPAVVVLSPAAFALETADASRLAYEIAFIAGLGGTALALSTLGENRWILDQAGRGRRLGARAVGLAVGGAVGAAASLAVPLLVGSSLSFEWGAIGLALAMTLGHVTGLALLLWKVPVAPAARPLLLPLLAWILPSSLAPDDRFLGALVTLLGADRNLEWFRETNLTGLITVLAPIVALWTAAALLEGRSWSATFPQA